MQSSNSRGYSEAHKSGKSAAASSCRSSVPPGALASYLQAQQAWRRLQASEKAIEQTCTRLRSSSHDQNDVFSGSCSSCNTSERKHGVNSLYSLPAHGCKAVARLFEQRHQLLNIHRHQRQVAKRCRVNTCHVEPAAGLLSLPEDVLMHTAMMLHFTYVTPHRHVEEVFSQRNMGKKRPAFRAPPASGSTNRAKIKIAAPRALQFQDNTEVSSCMELSESTALAN